MFSLRQLSDKLNYCHGQDLKAEQSTRKPCKHGKGDFNTQTRSALQPHPTTSCTTTTLLLLLWNYKKASFPILKEDYQQQKPKQRKISLNHLKTNKWKRKGKKKSLNCLFCTSVKLIFQLLISCDLAISLSRVATKLEAAQIFIFTSRQQLMRSLTALLKKKLSRPLAR